MKITACCVCCLVAAVVLAGAIGYAPTESRWGAPGVRSMVAVGGICLATALIGAVPMIIFAARNPQHMGQAALAGTALRLLLTMAGIAGYQVAAKPHASSFLFWAVVFYLLLLMVETSFSVILVRRSHRPLSATKGASA